MSDIHCNKFTFNHNNLSQAGDVIVILNIIKKLVLTLNQEVKIFLKPLILVQIDKKNCWPFLYSYLDIILFDTKW